MRHTLAILVDNQPGVLMRVVGMFSRRGFNIESLAVGTTLVPHLSRITTVMCGSQAVMEQVIKQLEKLIEVRAVQVLPNEGSVVRGLALIKVRADKSVRIDLLKLAEVFRANVIDLCEQSLVLEVTGEESKIEALLEVLAPYEIIELVRTGAIGLERGGNTIRQQAGPYGLSGLYAALL